jgi:hypothetical protein
MKFYFIDENPKHNAPGVHRKAHILKNENELNGNCLCRVTLNKEKWIVVETLPEKTHLCRICERLVNHLKLESSK